MARTFLSTTPSSTLRITAVAPRIAAWLTLALALPSCQRSYPVAETNPVKPPVECLAPERPLATLTPAPEGGFPSAQCVQLARERVAKMTPVQKFGQMLQPDRGDIRGDALQTFHVGSILSGGGSGPVQNTPIGWARMVNEFREQSLKSETGIPVIYGIDAVHGHNNVRDAVIFPHNIGLGATRDPELVRRIGEATASAVRATNIDWDFAPVLAAARDERWGRTYEAFGETPELAELLGPAMIRGLQGERLGPHSVLACAKHFIGDGNTDGGKDQGNSLLGEQDIDHLLPAYQKSIDAGVGSVMASFSSINGIKMHCHGPLLNDKLKGEMGFGGFVVSDWQAIEKLPGQFTNQLTAAINAGVDMVMAPKVGMGFVMTMNSIVPDKIPMERIDDAVTRILTVKCELGMFDEDRYARDRSGNIRMDADAMAQMGGPERRALAREAVSKSLVLLKNDNDLLPLGDDKRRIHLSGSGADDIGRQCGGWTISWQGGTGDITKGTSIKQAFQLALGRSGQLTHSADGTGITDAQVAVAVIGEKPYAEMHGDRDDLALDAEDVQTIKKLKQAGIPVVVVLLSGRPMILGEVLDLADAIVAAWLPGTEGQGITDALLGQVPFSGKLPHSWPRSMDQIPINVGDANYDPLFAYGFGLTTGQPPVADGAQPQSEASAASAAPSTPPAPGQ